MVQFQSVWGCKSRRVLLFSICTPSLTREDVKQSQKTTVKSNDNVFARLGKFIFGDGSNESFAPALTA